MDEEVESGRNSLRHINLRTLYMKKAADSREQELRRLPGGNLHICLRDFYILTIDFHITKVKPHIRIVFFDTREPS